MRVWRDLANECWWAFWSQIAVWAFAVYNWSWNKAHMSEFTRSEDA